MKAISKQYKTRCKHEKIKCPDCGATSRVTTEIYFGIQTRKCKNGHYFIYSYLNEAVHNMLLNYKIRI